MWYLAAHKYLYFILRIAIEIEEFLEEFFGMQHENAFWLNFMVDKIVHLSFLCAHYLIFPFYAIWQKIACLTNYREKRSFPWPLVLYIFVRHNPIISHTSKICWDMKCTAPNKDNASRKRMSTTKLQKNYSFADSARLIFPLHIDPINSHVWDFDSACSK